MNKLDYALWMIERLAMEMLAKKPDVHTLTMLRDQAKALRESKVDLNI